MKKLFFILTFVLGGLGCFSQNQPNTEDNLTLRDEDLPYDSTANLSSENLTDGINRRIESSAICRGTVIYVDFYNKKVYKYDTLVDKPNAVFIFYSNNGNNNFTYYPYAPQVLYSSWYYWPMCRYSSWESFHYACPFFQQRINYGCNHLNFGQHNYGYPRILGGYHYEKRNCSGNYNGSSNGGYSERGTNSNRNQNGGYTYSTPNNKHGSAQGYNSNSSVRNNNNSYAGSNGRNSSSISRSNGETSYTFSTRSENSDRGTYSTPTRSKSSGGGSAIRK